METPNLWRLPPVQASSPYIALILRRRCCCTVDASTTCYSRCRLSHKRHLHCQPAVARAFLADPPASDGKYETHAKNAKNVARNTCRLSTQSTIHTACHLTADVRGYIFLSLLTQTFLIHLRSTLLLALPSLEKETSAKSNGLVDCPNRVLVHRPVPATQHHLSRLVTNSCYRENTTE